MMTVTFHLFLFLIGPPKHAFILSIFGCDDRRIMGCQPMQMLRSSLSFVPSVFFAAGDKLTHKKDPKHKQE